MSNKLRLYIKDNIHGREWDRSYDTQEELDQWFNEMKAKNNFGSNYTHSITNEDNDPAFKSKMNKQRRAQAMPSYEEKVDALLEGGVALGNLKAYIQSIKDQYPI
jgi:hypothetical protein